MRYMSIRERCIMIQNGRLKEVEVNTMLWYCLLWVTKKINCAMTGEKMTGMAKIFSGKSAMK